jgi:copper chaperone CopZ
MEVRMKKAFKLEELDCANCAAKMENQINKLEGVVKASVSFMAQKLTLEAEDDRFEDIVKEVVKLIKKIEPDCRLILK